MLNGWYVNTSNSRFNDWGNYLESHEKWFCQRFGVIPSEKTGYRLGAFESHNIVGFKKYEEEGDSRILEFLRKMVKKI